jgi:hypothetical protein
VQFHEMHCLRYDSLPYEFKGKYSGGKKNRQ